MNFLSRDEILNAPDLAIEVVEIPEWGGAIRVRGLNGEERDRFEASVVQIDGKKTKMNMSNMRARLVALTAVDEQGKRLFKFSDVEALGKKNAAALDRIFDKAMELSGMREEDIDELVANFTSDQAGDFTSS